MNNEQKANVLSYEVMEVLINDSEAKDKFQKYMNLACKVDMKKGIQKVIDLIKDHNKKSNFADYTIIPEIEKELLGDSE